MQYENFGDYIAQNNRSHMNYVRIKYANMENVNRGIDESHMAKKRKKHGLEPKTPPMTQ